ncbi:glutaredoxin Grx1, putative [Talaromyces stipitatus ATCC 10500]|uniref:Glutaredoxin Grx1, putative n=1 Tax=Talaromyces stipitatus (strain ATCC 10500 / CBS 375.48 / QM 6759 / NRRL 1006) TaxID=441959 RepID=B8M835_TALSN|nr:glutaredoxin Grx1, putative [Talaromyces stipitatus ATCC 10500]XP_002480432.1 glutaredoxin Grx1, putative [Talaromyces stipitatus ATCC 10500]EED19997.1 glutaredoxin Grx1, putative [Talaromyces stipitatus ATCC 10500]EED19998.1 glutaredoxin Grx1, putative [Talaromyces stipitatus ATCC 10500]
MSAAKVKAQSIIDENKVVVFSKSYCPYCKATKSLLSGLGAPYYVLELDQVDDGAAIQDALEEITSQRSVPNIFINKQHIGGNSDLQGRKDELPQLLKDAGAL